MNILYTNFHFNEGGGHTTYILSLLKNPEHTLFVACPESSRLFRTLTERGFPRLIPIDFYAKPKHFKLVVKNTLLLKRAIEEHDIDIVHTNGSPDNRMAFYARLLSKKKFKIVLTKHNAQRMPGRISRWRFSQVNDAVIFVSEEARREVGYAEHRPHFHVIENGIDLEHWKRQTPVATGEKLRLISTAGTVLPKGWIHMAEAIAKLSEAERARLSVSVPGRYETDFEEMQSRARALCGMEFPGFFLDPRPLLEEADIAFNLSYREACSFAQREMMAMSLPIIVSDWPSLACNVDPGCGWVTRMKDADSIAEVLRHILAMPPEELNTMKLAARKRAEENFSLEQMIEKTNQVYAGLARA